jgi:hypothetical protein
MFRQDYRINKIFLPFQKKGKKHPLLIALPFFPLKRNCDFSASSPPVSQARALRAGGSREKNQVNPVNPVRKHFGFMSK